ncbi:MAG: hypothetical protein IJI42_02745 [Methanobrevibacter sp.]|nr:hypothetical protein [Methanobrevibacter sp.]
MEIKRKLLVLLAIFCVIGSAGIACAADNSSYDGNNNPYMNGIDESQNANDNGGYAGSQYYNNAEPGAGLPLENQTNPYAGNTTNDATGNMTGNATNNATGNATHNMTGNTTPANSNNKMLTTGNPILALLAVSAIIGGYGVIRREK